MRDDSNPGQWPVLRPDRRAEFPFHESLKIEPVAIQPAKRDYGDTISTKIETIVSRGNNPHPKQRVNSLHPVQCATEMILRKGTGDFGPDNRIRRELGIQSPKDRFARP